MHKCYCLWFRKLFACVSLQALSEKKCYILFPFSYSSICHSPLVRQDTGLYTAAKSSSSCVPTPKLHFLQLSFFCLFVSYNFISLQFFHLWRCVFLPSLLYLLFSVFFSVFFRDQLFCTPVDLTPWSLERPRKELSSLTPIYIFWSY